MYTFFNKTLVLQRLSKNPLLKELNVNRFKNLNFAKTTFP